MTARADFEYAVRQALTRAWAMPPVLRTEAMNDATDAILIAADAYAARCIAAPVSNVADHPLATAARCQAAVAEADHNYGRRPRNRNRQGETL